MPRGSQLAEFVQHTVNLLTAELPRMTNGVDSTVCCIANQGVENEFTIGHIVVTPEKTEQGVIFCVELKLSAQRTNMRTDSIMFYRIDTKPLTAQ